MTIDEHPTNEYQNLTLRIVNKDGSQYTCFEWFDTETKKTERRYGKNINDEEQPK